MLTSHTPRKRGVAWGGGAELRAIAQHSVTLRGRGHRRLHLPRNRGPCHANLTSLLVRIARSRVISGTLCTMLVAAIRWAAGSVLKSSRQDWCATSTVMG